MIKINDNLWVSEIESIHIRSSCDEDNLFNVYVNYKGIYTGTYEECQQFVNGILQKYYNIYP